MKAICAGVLWVAAILPASAASVTTDAFIANARPTITALAAADRLAEATSASARVRAFARRDATVQSRAATDFESWRVERERLVARDAAAPTLDGLGPVANALAVPFGALADGVALAGPVLTPLPSADLAEAASRADLQRLATTSGATFDTSYVGSQLARLDRLEAVYKDFVLNGDDTRLRKIAVDELPRIRGLIAALRGL